MSHSLNDPKRAWDAGMRDDDLVSIVVFEQNDDSPINLQQISPVHFICIKLDFGHFDVLRGRLAEAPWGILRGRPNP